MYVVLMIFCIFVFSGSATAGLYRWVDENGDVHYSDTPVAQDKKASKFEKISGGADESIVDSGEWFNCIERPRRAEVAASELLEQQEGWPTTPVFSGHNRQFVNGFMLELHYDAKLPNNVVKEAGCAYGYQAVKVKTEQDSKDRTKCRILGVELGQKRLEPPKCRK
jgi:hypothetical protein